MIWKKTSAYIVLLNTGRGYKYIGADTLAIAKRFVATGKGESIIFHADRTTRIKSVKKK